MRDWELRLGGDGMDCAAFPKLESGCWVKGPTSTAFSLAAEKELLNQLSVPAHFVALNGSKLNVHLKTGSDVRVLGPGCWGEGMWQLPEHLSLSPALVASTV